MITQYQISLQNIPEHPFYANSAYHLYAWLLDQLPKESSQWLHDIGSSSISQYLRIDHATKHSVWTLNLLSTETADLLQATLQDLSLICIEHQTIPVANQTIKFITAEELVEQGHSCIHRNTVVTFQSPTAFKQNGRYTIFPQEKLILQSLVSHWNMTFPEYPLQDPDAFRVLLAGIHIVDYQLRTTRFHLKNAKIPGFCGKCILEAKLALPLLELWNTLLHFAVYSGIGIKTSLGMGGISINS